MKKLIRVDNLTKTYKQGKTVFNAIDNLSMTVSQGEMLVIMGTSGSGKTTLLNIIGGLDKPSLGKVVIEDHTISDVTDEKVSIEFRRRTIGFVFQDFNLLQSLTVEENIQVVLSVKNVTVKKARIDEVLDKLHIKRLIRQPVHHLSGGEKQRVAIALAILSDSNIILADEPTGNLDSKLTAELMLNFIELQKDSGKTMIVVTHDPLVATYGDRIVFLNNGTVSGELVVDQSKTKKENMFEIIDYFYEILEKAVI